MVSNFVKNDFPATYCNSMMSSVSQILMTNTPVVVLENKNHSPVGVLTIKDLLHKEAATAGECVKLKPVVPSTCPIEKALEQMNEMETDILLVYDEKGFMGPAYRSDLEENNSTFLAGQQENNAELLRAIYESTRSIRLVLDINRRILFYNRTASLSFRGLFGMAIENGQDFAEIIPPQFRTAEKNFDELLWRAVNGDHICFDSVIRIKKEMIWINTEFFPVLEDGRVIGISVCIKNINARKNDQFLLEKQNKVLRDIIFFQTHEVRRPVASIQGILSLIDRKSLTPENAHLMDLLSVAATELDQVVRTIVDKAANWKRSNETESQNAHPVKSFPAAR